MVGYYLRTRNFAAFRGGRGGSHPHATRGTRATINKPFSVPKNPSLAITGRAPQPSLHFVGTFFLKVTDLLVLSALLDDGRNVIWGHPYDCQRLWQGVSAIGFGVPIVGCAPVGGREKVCVYVWHDCSIVQGMCKLVHTQVCAYDRLGWLCRWSAHTLWEKPVRWVIDRSHHAKSCFS